MQKKKKYYLNVSSYKYKRECMKLFPNLLSKTQNNINKDQGISYQNLCPGGKNCLNYSIICQLEQKIKSLTDTINQLKKINAYSEIMEHRNSVSNNEEKKQENINELCNSFRNSNKKRTIKGFENKNLTASNSLSTLNAPYKIRPYSSEQTESKEPFKKILNRKFLQLDTSNNYRYSRFREYNSSFNKNNNSDYLSFRNSNKSNSIDNIDNSYKENLNNNENNSNKEKESEILINEEIQTNSNKKNEKNDNVSSTTDSNSKNNSGKNIDEKKIPIDNKNFKTQIPIKKYKNRKIIQTSRYSKINYHEKLDYNLSEPITNKNQKNENKMYFLKFKGRENKQINKFSSSFTSCLSSGRPIKTFDYNFEQGNDDENKNNKFTKLKIPQLKNLMRSVPSQKPFKIKINIDNILVNKFNNTVSFNNKSNKFLDIDFQNMNLSDIPEPEFHNFLKKLTNNLGLKSDNNKDANNLFRELYNLSFYKNEILNDKIKNIENDKMNIYFDIINFTIKYLVETLNLIHILRLYHNSNNFNNAAKNLNFNDEFKKYKEDAIKLLQCENVYIFIYDLFSDYLILKGNSIEEKFQKNKDLTGLSLSTPRKVKYDSNNKSSSILLRLIPEQKIENKINNILIYPIKDKNGEIHGVIEAINKISDPNDNKNNSFNKNDEIIMSLLSKDLGNLCRYYNYAYFQKNLVNYYCEIFEFIRNLFFKNENCEIRYFLVEISRILKNIFDFSEIQFLLNMNQTLLDIQKLKKIPSEGIVYSSLIEKKIIFSSNPLKNLNYKNSSDLVINSLSVNNQEQLLTFPIFKNIDEIYMIIQLKTNKKLGVSSNTLTSSNDKLSSENELIIKNISLIIQKYLLDNEKILNLNKRF